MRILSAKEVVVFAPRTSNFIGFNNQFYSDTLLIGNISERYKISFSEFSFNELNNRILGVHHKVVSGVSQSEALINDPYTYVDRKLEFYTTEEEGIVHVYIDGIIWEFLSNPIWVFPAFTLRVEDHKWAGDIFLTEFKNDIYASTVTMIGENNDMTDAYLSPLFLIWDGEIQPFLAHKPPADVLLVDSNNPMVFGKNPIFCNALIVNNYFEDHNFVTPLSFYGANNEYRFDMHNKSTLKLFDINNNLILSDSNNLVIQENLPEEYYRIEFTTNNYSVQGLEGQLKLISDFDLSSADPIPPKITSFKFLDQNTQVRDHFIKDDSIKVYFSAADFEYLPTDTSAIINYKLLDTSKTKILSRINRALGWKEMDMSIVSEDSTLGFLYKTNLSSYAYLDSASIDLQLQFQDLAGNITHWTISPAFTVGKMPVIVNIEDIITKGNSLPDEYSLSQNYPNPFNPTTTIKYTIPSVETHGHASVQLVVYDVLGREVTTLVNKEQKSGSYEVEFDANNLTSGIYFYKLQSGGFVESKKMLLLK